MPHFISLDGYHKTGKSYHAVRLANELTNNGYKVELTCDPNDNYLYTIIKKINDIKYLKDLPLLFWNLTNTIMHYNELILPLTKSKDCDFIIGENHIFSSLGYVGCDFIMNNIEYIKHIIKYRNINLIPFMSFVLIEKSILIQTRLRTQMLHDYLIKDFPDSYQDFCTTCKYLENSHYSDNITTINLWKGKYSSNVLYSYMKDIILDKLTKYNYMQNLNLNI